MTRLFGARRRLAPAIIALGSLLMCAVPAQTGHAVGSGGTLTIGATSDALTLDPTLTTDEASGPVENLLFNSLVKLNDKVQIVPDLASSWDISPAGTTYTFHLRSGVRFHDGTVMTANDVAASLARLRDKKTASPWASFFTDVTSVATPNPTTIVIKLSQPYGPFLAVLASFLSVSSANFVAAHKGNLTRVEDGTGPYMLKSWVPNTSITLVRNPHYFVAGQPHFDSVVFQVIPTDASRVAALRTGAIQFAAFIDPIYFPQVQQLKAAGQASVLHVLDINYHMFGFNTKRKPFDNPLVRLAISYAIDRGQILKAAGQNQGVVTGLLTPALQSWALPISQYAPYTPNLAKARQLLAQAGYPHGFSFSIMASHFLPSDYTAAEIIQQQLAPLGIKATIATTEWGVYVHDWVVRNFDSFTGENGDWTDPDLAMYAALHTGGSTNAFQFSDPSIDKLLDQARAATSTAARKALYDQIQLRLVNDGGPMVYTYASYWDYAMSPNVKGFTYIPRASYQGLVGAYFQ
ncbi:MAG TPA: ABC transporter substrate-binding protein [Chloroflexota bacterium]|nr:ABC transporter substrate-binding protein [Chloroflexota bacterium]